MVIIDKRKESAHKICIITTTATQTLGYILQIFSSSIFTSTGWTRTSQYDRCDRKISISLGVPFLASLSIYLFAPLSRYTYLRSHYYLWPFGMEAIFKFPSLKIRDPIKNVIPVVLQGMVQSSKEYRVISFRGTDKKAQQIALRDESAGFSLSLTR